MQVIVYRLREAGRPLTYSEAKARASSPGTLAYGTSTDPARHATLRDGERNILPELRSAEVVRISGGCVLLQGFEAGRTPSTQQTWLCAPDLKSGEAALRKIRPPTTADFPLGDWDDDGPD